MGFFAGQIPTPVSVALGGTGAADAATALTNLGVPSAALSRLNRTAVALTSAAQTTLYTVPAGKTLYVFDVLLEGKTAITGTIKTATLKVGTTAGSYAELLNGSSGYSFVTATGTSLLAVGSGISTQTLSLPATASVAMVRKFAAGSVIKADVSGVSLPDAGEVYVEIIGVVE